ncbi:MAG: 2Fe-2S iron-sulfur cluster binding domain-containing protein [Deltaproteobacteria bacterium]|nr:2Fe-2S iron-sulfur cluster binding domain-containing protein [Deltaproteobacteria bacterium]MBI3293712.1 2Fe-2S iron-sulfur cluster binding domain-containing protein [Deltaproteobacteria bacterium]
MGGSNPYINSPNPPRPKTRYRIHIKGLNQTIEVDPNKIPYSVSGLPGSILEIALGNGVSIDHACGGVCACSTCHIYVTEGANTCPPAQDAELDMLDNAPDLRPTSRLACQCVPNGSADVTIEIPEWNRNLVREGGE